MCKMIWLCGLCAAESPDRREEERTLSGGFRLQPLPRRTAGRMTQAGGTAVQSPTVISAALGGRILKSQLPRPVDVLRNDSASVVDHAQPLAPACEYWAAGYCRFGERCTFRHSNGPNATPPSTIRSREAAFSPDSLMMLLEQPPGSPFGLPPLPPETPWMPPLPSGMSSDVTPPTTPASPSWMPPLPPEPVLPPLPPELGLPPLPPEPSLPPLPPEPGLPPLPPEADLASVAGADSLGLLQEGRQRAASHSWPGLPPLSASPPASPSRARSAGALDGMTNGRPRDAKTPRGVGYTALEAMARLEARSAAPVTLAASKDDSDSAMSQATAAAAPSPLQPFAFLLGAGLLPMPSLPELPDIDIDVVHSTPAPLVSLPVESCWTWRVFMPLAHTWGHSSAD